MKRTNNTHPSKVKSVLSGCTQVVAGASLLAGRVMIIAARTLDHIEPLIMLTACAGLVLLHAVPALAQSTSSGPISVFGRSDQDLGRGLLSFVRYARNGLWLMGIIAFMWGALNIWMEKPWFRQMAGGTACLGIGTLIALADSFSKGQTVDLNTDLGQ